MPLTQNRQKAAGGAPRQFLAASRPLLQVSYSHSHRPNRERELPSSVRVRPSVRPSVRPGREKIISVTLIALRFGSRHSLTLPASSFSSILPLLISRRSIAINELTVIADRLPIGGDRVRREASEEKTRREASERVEGDAAMR